MIDTNFINLKKGKDIKEVQILPSLKEIESKLSDTVEYFFSERNEFDIPFRGFLLEGNVGTGKTEIVKQIVRKLDRRIREVYLLFVDGSSIASKGWGEAEQKLKAIFSKAEKENKKIVILLDDIESLFIARGASLSKEWHYSINSVLFHQLDTLNPFKTIVFATTNKIDLVDDAIRSRLFFVKFPNPTIKQLMKLFEAKVRPYVDEGIYQSLKEKIEEELNRLIKINGNVSIRDVEKAIISNCIELGVWKL